VIATSILVVTPERAIYYYGASVSDLEARKVKAPEALQWKMIQDAKIFGATTYDLLGIANP
jgi:lipid II:glycine glycyltransferase (peptidoglycan interpeptide bridge formation enzyme)